MGEGYITFTMGESARLRATETSWGTLSGGERSASYIRKETLWAELNSYIVRFTFFT